MQSPCKPRLENLRKISTAQTHDVTIFVYMHSASSRFYITEKVAKIRRRKIEFESRVEIVDLLDASLTFDDVSPLEKQHNKRLQQVDRVYSQWS